MLMLLFSLGCTVPEAPVPPATPPLDDRAPAGPTQPPLPPGGGQPQSGPPAGPQSGPQSGPQAGPLPPMGNDPGAAAQAAALGLPPGALTAPSGPGGRSGSTQAPEMVATDLSTWHGSPPQMVAAAAKSSAERVAFADSIGAVRDISVYPATYTLTWIPPEGAKGVLVTLHGHEAHAYDALYVWYEYAKARSLAIVAVQWWDTLRAGQLDYLAPKPLLEVISATVKARFGATPPRVVLHGFSRGSAQVYGVVAWDRQGTPPLFSAVLADEGGVEQNYPTTQRINLGEFGKLPFDGMPWVLACSARDSQPDVSGCPAMQRTATWLEKQGATATLLTDKEGGHGGFQQNKATVKQALDLLFPG